MNLIFAAGIPSSIWATGKRVAQIEHGTPAANMRLKGRKEKKREKNWLH